MKIKSLPAEEQPREKALLKGVTTLSNTELVALILHTGTREGSALRLAEELLSHLDHGLRSLPLVSPQELMQIRGIGASTACAISAVGELSRRMGGSSAHMGHRILSSEDAANLVMEELRYEKKEQFRNILVDSRGHVIKVETVSVGELNSTIVHPREVFSLAVRCSASGVILVHNHPSGDPFPSEEDRKTTDRLRAA